jgi:hypothetical protein
MDRKWILYGDNEWNPNDESTSRHSGFASECKKPFVSARTKNAAGDAKVLVEWTMPVLWVLSCRMYLSESQLPHEIVILFFTITNKNIKFTISWGNRLFKKLIDRYILSDKIAYLLRGT